MRWVLLCNVKRESKWNALNSIFQGNSMSTGAESCKKGFGQNTVSSLAKSVEMLPNIFRACCKESAYFLSFNCSKAISQYWDESALFCLLVEKRDVLSLQFDGADLANFWQLFKKFHLSSDSIALKQNCDIIVILRWFFTLALYGLVLTYQSRSWSWMNNVNGNGKWMGIRF